MTHIWLTGDHYHPCLALCLSLDDSVLVMTYTSIIYDLCCYCYPLGIVFVPGSVQALPPVNELARVCVGGIVI